MILFKTRMNISIVVQFYPWFKFYLTITDTPKSGEVELQMAPRLAVANMASTASAQLGM